MSREYSRTDRVSQLLKEEIARLLQEEVKDQRIGRTTITDAEVTADLKYANIFVQIPGDEAHKEEVLEGLNSAAGFMRTRLGEELRIRRVPELRFEIDRTPERAARIEELLQQIHEEEDGTGDGE